MALVLYLDPVGRPAGAVRAIAALGHHALESHLAGRPEQIRADLALLKLADENPLRTPRQEPRQTVLAEMQWELPKILAKAKISEA
jgi:hypothetical protein